MPYHIYILRASGQIEHTIQPKAPKLDQLQAAVGGYIETIPYFSAYAEGQRGLAYADEDGIAKGLPVNRNASAAWWANLSKRSGAFSRSFLHGDVIYYAKEKAQ